MVQFCTVNLKLHPVVTQFMKISLHKKIKHNFSKRNHKFYAFCEKIPLLHTTSR